MARAEIAPEGTDWLSMLFPDHHGEHRQCTELNARGRRSPVRSPAAGSRPWHGISMRWSGIRPEAAPILCEQCPWKPPGSRPAAALWHRRRRMNSSACLNPISHRKHRSGSIHESTHRKRRTRHTPASDHAHPEQASDPDRQQADPALCGRSRRRRQGSRRSASSSMPTAMKCRWRWATARAGA